MTQKKMGNGKWKAEFSAGYNKEGKQLKYRKQGFKTKKEAQDWETSKRNEAMKGYLETNSSKIFFGDFLDKWYNNYKKIKISKNTQNSYLSRINNHIKPALGNYKLSEITNYIIQNFYNDLIIKTKLKPDSAKKTIEILTGVFRYAKKNKLIAEMPTDIEKQPISKEDKKIKLNGKKWNIEQSKIFLNEVINTYLFLPVFLELNIGTRPGELCGLQWKDVDFKKCIISINKQALVDKTTKSVYVTDTLKTITSEREIPISFKTQKMLKKEKEIRNAKNEDFIITEMNDINFIAKTPCRSNNLNENFVRKIKQLNKNKQLNLPAISFNGLRHTHATILAEENLNIKAVSLRLGHENIQTTLTYYTHVTEKMQTQICTTLDKIF